MRLYGSRLSKLPTGVLWASCHVMKQLFSCYGYVRVAHACLRASVCMCVVCVNVCVRTCVLLFSVQFSQIDPIKTNHYTTDSLLKPHMFGNTSHSIVCETCQKDLLTLVDPLVGFISRITLIDCFYWFDKPQTDGHTNLVARCAHIIRKVFKDENQGMINRALGYLLCMVVYN